MTAAAAPARATVTTAAAPNSPPANFPRRAGTGD